MGKLVNIVLDMEREAKWKAYSYRELRGGLRLQLNWMAGAKVLTLSRAGCPPSETEVSVCRNTFGVPLDAQRDDGDTTVTLRWKPDRRRAR